MLAQILLPVAEGYMLGFLQRELPRYEKTLGQKAQTWIKKNILYVQFNLTSKVELLVGLELLTQLDEVYLLSHKRTVPLYQSGVNYIVEAEGKEEWLTIPVLYQRGWGDCEDMACALAAERRVRGFNCNPFVSKQGRVWHVQTVCGDLIEDPSRVLGMGR